jgi:cytochrome c
MITLALHEEAYAAYDAHHCRLYKVWRGGIHLDGAAYNDVKTVQPASWGTPYWVADSSRSSWQIEEGGQRSEVWPSFKGYHLKDGRITFQYEIGLDDGTKVRLTEQPEYVPEGGGGPALLRTFQTDGVPGGTQLLIDNRALAANGKTRLRQDFDPVPPPTSSGRIVSGNNSQYWLDRSGCNTCHMLEQKTIGPAYQQIAVRYPKNEETIKKLALKVQKGGSGTWGEVLMNPHPHLKLDDLERMVSYILSLQPEPEKKKKTAPLTSPQSSDPIVSAKTPGFGASLTGLHPSFEIKTIRPSWFRPRVGAMDFLPDGRLLVATWDSLGAVYALTGVETGDTSQIEIKRIAAGLHEPLGMKVVDGDIFVMQKQELTQLIDHDGDEIIDEYRAICNSFGATADFHEFSYGLEYEDGYFYATLGLAMRLMSQETQHPDRGTTIRIDREGNFSIVNNGLRQPNGVGRGVNGEIFLTENQGQWVPACKVIHVQPGDFHGCRFHAGDRYAGKTMKPPAVWLPQDEIGNSPSQPVPLNKGPYRNQMLHGEVTHGGIKRVFLEMVNGEYQGAVFRFTQGLEAGINRLVWGPDGALYAGGVGMNGGWAWDNRQYGLQKLVYNGLPTFEMLAVRATPQGLDVEFTKPLAEGQGELPEDYFIQQWWYRPTERYGGPKLDLKELPVSEVIVSEDRKTVRLSIPGREEGHVLYLRLAEDMTSRSGKKLWSGECWYTLNAIPDNEKISGLEKMISD